MLETAQHVHGVDGMGDIGLQLSGREPSDVHAVDALLEASHQHAGTLTLVTLGPLTNIAMALQRDPTLPERIARCVVMGAVADHVGNTNPVAEFNMWVDPHAVDVVLRSGLAIEFVGLGHLTALRRARSDRRRRAFARSARRSPSSASTSKAS